MKVTSQERIGSAKLRIVSDKEQFSLKKGDITYLLGEYAKFDSSEQQQHLKELAGKISHTKRVGPERDRV